MHSSCKAVLSASLWLLFMDVCAQAEPVSSPPVTAEVISHIYKPVGTEPTDQRLQQLQLPTGFEVEKFASKLGAPGIRTT